MSDSFQNEIPKARVNITLDLETGGAKKKLELPMKLLVMGDFTQGKTKGRLSERDRININANNFEKVLKDFSPNLKFTVPNRIKNDDSDVNVDITIDSLKSFHPEKVAEQVPELHSLLAMRNLLKDLKSNLLDNTRFRKELERILNNKPEMAELKSELEKLLSVQAEAAGEEATE